MLTPTFQFLKFVFKKKIFFLENLAFSFESGNQSGGGYWIWGYCCVPFQLPDTTISCFPVWAFFRRWGSRGSGRWLQFCDWALEHRNLSVSQLLELDSNLSFFFVAKNGRKCGLVDRKQEWAHEIWIPDLKSSRSLSFSVAIMLCN